jgi:hypothetical protein
VEEREKKREKTRIERKRREEKKETYKCGILLDITMKEAF